MKNPLRKLKKTVVLLMKCSTYCTLFLIFFVTFWTNHSYIIDVNRTTAITMFTFVVIGLLLLKVYGKYDIGKQKSKPIIHSLVLATLITDVVTYLNFCIMTTNIVTNNQFHFYSPHLLVIAMILQIIFIIAWTYAGNYVYFVMHEPEKVCIITSSQSSLNKLIPKLRKYKKQYKINDIVDYNDKAVWDIILRNRTIFIYDVPVQKRTELIEYCYDNSKNIYYNPEICDVVSVNAKHVVLDDKSLISLEMGDLSFEQRFLKRTMDIVASLAGLIILSPIMIVSALAIKLHDGGKVFFKQERATKNHRIFKVYKFRTMKENVENISAAEGDDRITPVGKILRKIRMDELPQLINILKGDMSLVGPRPEMMENVYQYTSQYPEFEYRLRVKAGLTGYAQIVGKYNTSPKDKLFLDLMYIENYSIFLDIKLIFQTLIVFLKSDSTEGFKEETEIEFVKYDTAKAKE